MDVVQKNKEFAIRHFEAINRRDIQAVVDNMVPNLHDHELDGGPDINKRKISHQGKEAART